MSADDFDPYHKWLGISAAEQPPNHYRLLGINVFESDADVIQAAADQRTAHVRTLQAGPHSALSQRLLNEIAAVKVCLLNAAKKAAYDADLSSRATSAVPVGRPVAVRMPTLRQTSEASPITGETIADPPQSAFEEILPAPLQSRRSHPKKPSVPYTVIGGVIGVMILGVVAVAIISANRKEPNEIERLPSPVASVQPCLH